MSEMKPIYLTLLTLVICELGVWKGISEVEAYREEGRILKWSPAWLSSDPDSYVESRVINRPSPMRSVFYKRLTDDDPSLSRWSPWYFPRTWKVMKRGSSSPPFWDGGDSYPSAGSPEWIRDDDLLK